MSRIGSVRGCRLAGLRGRCAAELGCKSERDRENGCDFAALTLPPGWADEAGQVGRTVKNDAREVRMDGGPLAREPSLRSFDVSVAEAELRVRECGVQSARSLGDDCARSDVIVEALDLLYGHLRTPAAAPHPMASDLEDLLALEGDERQDGRAVAGGDDGSV